eukprot:5151202-Pyramimonas_sp.AAC.1
MVFAFGDFINFNVTQTVPTNVLQRHTWVYDGTNVSLYVNGSQIGSTTGVDFYGPTMFMINAVNDLQGERGRIPMNVYGVNLYQSALDETQLSQLWNNNVLSGNYIQPVPPDLTPHIDLSVAYWSRFYEK